MEKTMWAVYTQTVETWKMKGSKGTASDAEKVWNASTNQEMHKEAQFDSFDEAKAFFDSINLECRDHGLLYVHECKFLEEMEWDENAEEWVIGCNEWAEFAEFHRAEVEANEDEDDESPKKFTFSCYAGSLMLGTEAFKAHYHNGYGDGDFTVFIDDNKEVDTYTTERWHFLDCVCGNFCVFKSDSDRETEVLIELSGRYAVFNRCGDILLQKWG